MINKSLDYNEKQKTMEDIANFNKKVNSRFYDQTDSDNVCFLCGNPDYKLLYEINHFGLNFKFKKCICGIVKQTPTPNEKFFKMFFNSTLFYSSIKENKEKVWGYDDYFRDEYLRIRTSKRRSSKLKEYLDSKKKSKILKIGPGTGSLLGLLKKEGHEVFGVDLSSRFADYAEKMYGVKISEGRFEKQNYQNEQFDMVLLFNVIENINNLDEFLSEINRVLKTNGYFVFNYVDMKNNIVEKIQKENYFVYRPPVCYIFNKRVIDKVLSKYGMESVKMTRDIRYLSLEKIFTLLGWNRFLKIITFFKINRFFIPIYAYPSKIVIAKKMNPIDKSEN